MPLWARRPCFLVNHLLHFAVEVLARLGGLGSRAPWAQLAFDDHQLALGSMKMPWPKMPRAA